MPEPVPDAPHPNPVFAAVGAAVAFVALCLILGLGLRVAAELLCWGVARVAAAS